MRLFYFLISSMLIGSTLSCVENEHAPANQANILFIFADDQTFDTINYLGNESINTPNLDRLAKQGRTFTHSYNMGGWNGAICTASRSMLQSGRFIWQANEMRAKWSQADSLALTQTWGRILSRNGYDTYMSGKWHVEAPADLLFDTAKNIRPGMPPDPWRHANMGQRIDSDNYRIEDLKDIMPFGYHRPNSPSDTSWSPSDPRHGGFWDGGKHWSEVLKDDAIEFIETASQSDKPFMMYLAFNAPHDPRQAPQSFVDQYPIENIDLPPNWQAMYPDKDGIGNGPGLRDEALAPFPRTEYAIKVHLQEYYAIITHMDEQIGLILDALEASGKADNTYIFFTADHGLAVGQHGLLGKQNQYDHSIRVPLIVSGPDIPENTRSESQVYLQDLMPTSLEIAGIEIPNYVQFRSFLSQATTTSDKDNYTSIYGAYVDLQRMILKDGYKLIVYPKIGKRLLFDMEKDPWEVNDISETMQEKTNELLEELFKLQEEMEDGLDLRPFFPGSSE